MENCCWPSWKNNKLFTILIVLVMIGLFGLLATIVTNNLKSYRYIGKPTAERDTIAISGEGKVTAIPDIATIDVGLMTEKSDVKSAQLENTTKMNRLIANLKNLGVESKDIQTSYYNIYPQYDWPNGKQVLRGYQVSQGVTVKIRNLDKIGDILAAAGEGGANQVSGLSFNIDDPEALRQEARVKALENAKTKAEALAKVAGVGLGKIVSFSEYASTPYSAYKSMEALGLGGGGAAPSPTVEAGSMDIVIDVTVSYEIK
ncbi:SIMPL domain-containing protein [Candidatus Falkowbacteria bacterium]|nr:SIMPL domain-containing protein [Candidatus Falkowbacteria bacterium]